jgi:hypothetical protein
VAVIGRIQPWDQTMKTSLRLLLAPVALTVALSTSAFAAESGHFDFGKFVGPEKGQFVDITLGKTVLKFTSIIAKCKSPDAAQLISGLSSVRVNVIGLDDANRQQTTERVQTIRKDLVRDGWEQIVTVRGKKQEDVAIFLKQRDGETVDGVVVTVIDERKKEAVLVNIVGQINAGQLAVLGEHLNIAQLQLGTKAEKI